jgi:hypothetical protein
MPTKRFSTRNRKEVVIPAGVLKGVVFASIEVQAPVAAEGPFKRYGCIRQEAFHKLRWSIPG